MSKLCSLAVLLLSLAATVEAGEKQALFNGKDLAGWQGDDKIWSVRDGQIIGSSVDHKPQANTFLVWQGDEVADFRLTLKARLEGDNNSGVQYRSQLKDPQAYRVAGYQMDIHSKPEYAAMLYGEGTGRGILAERGQKATLETDPKESQRVLKAFPTESVDVTKWHEYAIIARGNHLVHQLDGKTTIDVIDNHKQLGERGVIALQVHAGAPMTVYFKDIQLETLAVEPR
jgi:hypothetical protein